jgi:DNA polymerase-1
LLCIGLSAESESAVVLSERVLESGLVRDLLGEVLGRKRIIAQNGKFDLAGLAHLNPTGVLSALEFDTMLAHYSLDERRGTHSLDQLAIEYLGSPDWKAEFRRHVPGHNFADAPKDILHKYNAYDVSNTFLLKERLAKDMAAEGVTKVHDFLVRTSPVLMRMEMNGLGVDMEYNKRLEEESQATIAEHKEYLQHTVDSSSYNPNSWQQVKAAMKDKFGRTIKDTRADTIVKVMETAARMNNRPLYEFCKHHLAFKKEAKTYGTYIKGIRERVYDEDGRTRVYADFLLHGTVSGRLSSRNPNLQNITRGSRLRRQFVPSSPDNVFIQADYGQAELRVVCGLARDAYLREVFSDSSRDIHSEVATRFYGEDFTKEQRVRAKAVVFGLTYGREAYSLAMEHGMSTEQAQAYIDTFFNVIPHTVKWINELEEQVLGGDDLVTPFGRHRRFWLITNNNRRDVLKEARSFLPQSTASDLTLESANRLARQGLWDNLRIPIHDALIVEAPRKNAEEVAVMMRTTMEEVGREVFEDYIPFPVDIQYGDTWGDIQ